jgi:hypothetical protein
MTGFPNAFAWRAACAADAVLATWAGPWAVCFAIKSGSDATIFNFVEAQVAADPGTAAFTLAAPKTGPGFSSPFRRATITASLR